MASPWPGAELGRGTEDAMELRTCIIMLAVYSIVSAADNCSRSDGTDAGVERTAVRTDSAAGRVATHGHVIRSDTAWQAMVDTARVAVGRNDSAATRALRSFAATARHQAGSTNEVAAGALARSAAELDSVADGIDAGENP